ncbi:MAG: discoidin domain-containing protein [Polyangia bacterium]
MHLTRSSARLLLAALVAVVLLGGPARVCADAAVTLVNADGSGNQITRYDTQGNAINAHGSGIHKFGATYYLYGEDQSCGWFYSSASPTPRPPCGLKAYSSADLVHWTPEGPLFDVTTAFWRDACKSSGGTGGCWEPHVLYRRATDDYVLWILTDGRYYVLRADRPVGPFTEIGYATVARPPAQGDFDLLLDADGSAYIGFSNNNDRHIYVERLNSTFTSGSGVYVDTGAVGEGTALFARAGLYYVVYGPLCAYCPAATRYRSASALLGRWSAERQISADSCSGQPRKVSAIDTPSGPVYLFQSDQWNGSYNEALANYFWGPLAFRADGSIQTLSCARTVSLTLSGASPGALRPAPDLDQTSGQTRFTTNGACEIRDGGSRRLQTFTASRSGTLSTVSMTLYQKGTDTTSVDAGVTISVVSLDAAGAPRSTLSSETVSASEVLWSPHRVTVFPEIAVSAGTQYGIVVSSTATRGCYGWVYDDSNPYPGGQAAWIGYGFGTWQQEPARDLKFETTVRTTAAESNLAGGAAVWASSSTEGYGWSLPKVADGLTDSRAGQLGWVSSTRAAASNHAETLVVDLGSRRTIRRLTLYPRNDPPNTGENFPSDFTIETSSDGATWTAQLRLTAHAEPTTGAAQILALPAAVTARYVRIRATSLRFQQGGYYFALAEVAVS